MAARGTHQYDHIDKAKIDLVLKALQDNGSVISGDNPWTVDTRNHGVILEGIWNEGTSVLAVTIKDAAWYVPDSSVWDKIEPLMNKVRDGA